MTLSRTLNVCEKQSRESLSDLLLVRYVCTVIFLGQTNMCVHTLSSSLHIIRLQSIAAPEVPLAISNGNPHRGFWFSLDCVTTTTTVASSLYTPRRCGIFSPSLLFFFLFVCVPFPTRHGKSWRNKPNDTKDDGRVWFVFVFSFSHMLRPLHTFTLTVALILCRHFLGQRYLLIIWITENRLK